MSEARKPQRMPDDQEKYLGFLRELRERLSQLRDQEYERIAGQTEPVPADEVFVLCGLAAEVGRIDGFLDMDELLARLELTA